MEPPLSIEQHQTAIEMAADLLHENWREAWRAQNGDAPRWKAMKLPSIEWARSHPEIPAEALRSVEGGVREINIAALPNNLLPPQFSGENISSAQGAVKALTDNPAAHIDHTASIVHEQWLERNGSWAAEELKVPYRQLCEAEMEKDRVVVRAAQSALDSVRTPAVQPEPAVKAGSSAARFVAPAIIGVGAVIGGAVEGYDAYTQGKSAPEVAGATAKGAAHGVVDTVLPGARSGYSDVIGNRNLTVVDRALNAAADFTGTAMMVAGLATAAGLETGPLDIAPAAATTVAGLANLGVNAVKAGLKATGLAGKDQDGGYIYDGIALASKVAAKGYHAAFDSPSSLPESANKPPYGGVLKATALLAETPSTSRTDTPPIGHSVIRSASPGP